MKVYVVEDSRFVRERLVGMISEIEGMEVVGQAETAEEAIEGVLRTTPDVIVLDVTLAAGTGIDVMAEIKAQHLSARTIMITSHPHAQYREKCLAAGATHFFNKHSEFAALRGALEGIARQQDV